MLDHDQTGYAEVALGQIQGGHSAFATPFRTLFLPLWLTSEPIPALAQDNPPPIARFSSPSSPLGPG